MTALVRFLILLYEMYMRNVKVVKVTCLRVRLVYLAVHWAVASEWLYVFLYVYLFSLFIYWFRS